MDAKITKKSDQITKRLNGMLDRTKTVRGFLNRVIYPEYQNTQRSRWASLNASEGPVWKSLSARYAAYKRIKFADFPGGGTKMMIATQRLFNSVVGPSSEHKKIVTDKGIQVFTTVPYASDANKARDFTHFSRKTISNMKQMLRDYMTGKS